MVVGAAAGAHHTAVWTDTGELLTFGDGEYGRLCHGGEETELVPRLVEALAGKKVVGATAATSSQSDRSREDLIFTFGDGEWGQLGHGVPQNELVLVPRLVGALEDPESLKIKRRGSIGSIGDRVYNVISDAR